MLNIKSTLHQDDVVNVELLSPGHPVFKLEGFGHDNGAIDALVVKQEEGKLARNVSFATGLMNLVDPNALTIVLKSFEVAQLKAWCTFWCLHGSPSSIPDLSAVRTFQHQLGGPGAWTKMEVKNLTMLDSAIDKRFQGDKADVRLIARALKKSGGLEKLGEIITVDLFNGNNDRFVWPPPGQKYPGFAQKFQTLQNLGNVFIACGANGAGVPIGLDGFDPFNEFRDLNTAVNANEPTNSVPVSWPGRLLMQKNSGERKKFIQDVVADLEMALGPRSRKIPFGTKKRLGGNRKARILAGMASAERKLKTELQIYKSGTANIPLGLSSRMTALGW